MSEEFPKVVFNEMPSEANECITCAHEIQAWTQRIEGREDALGLLAESIIHGRQPDATKWKRTMQGMDQELDALKQFLREYHIPSHDVFREIRQPKKPTPAEDQLALLYLEIHDRRNVLRELRANLEVLKQDMAIRAARLIEIDRKTNPSPQAGRNTKD